MKGRGLYGGRTFPDRPPDRKYESHAGPIAHIVEWETILQPTEERALRLTASFYWSPS